MQAVAASVEEYVPATQSAQSSAEALPGEPELLPATQAMQSDSRLLAVPSAYRPASQATQTVGLVPAGVVLYVPAAQAIQSDAWPLPVASRYRPAAQAMQSAGSSLPCASTYRPAAHAMQLAAAGPACVLAVAYRPLAHAPEHEPVGELPEPYRPAAQALHVALFSAAEYMPAPHGAQARFALPHAVLTDWPAGQFWHVSHVSAIPVVSQYSVASHFEENVVPQESWVCAHAQLAQSRASAAALRGCTPAIGGR